MAELEWRCLNGFSRYEISEDGRVRFAVDVLMPFNENNCSQGIRFRKGRELKPIIKKPSKSSMSKINRVGYFLRNDDGKSYNVLAHRLVAEAFCERANGCDVVCHVDGNPDNNHYSNLYWGTYKTNAQDRWCHGTMCNGEKAPAAKLRVQDVLDIRKRLEDGSSIHSLAKVYGVKMRTIQAIKYRQNWKWL